MSRLKIAGVERASLFSPNHIGNDAAIFRAVTGLLTEAGYEVSVYSENGFMAAPIEEKVVFGMLRNEQAVQKLQRLESGKRCIAINSGFGIEYCYREKMTLVLVDNEVPHPQSWIISTLEEIGEEHPVTFPCWAKRGDFHAIHREDVSYIRNREELTGILPEYALRGIKRVVINEHLEGDLIKFYGVNGTSFFHWFYPYEHQHSKFGLESINGHARGISFSIQELQDICNQAARALQVHVYGGDAVVSPDGTIRLIDFNDWPSFAPCREEAARAIATLITDTIQNKF